MRQLIGFVVQLAVTQLPPATGYRDRIRSPSRLLFDQVGHAFLPRTANGGLVPFIDDPEPLTFCQEANLAHFFLRIRGNML